MTPAQFNTAVMIPGEVWFTGVVPEIPVDDRARTLLLAIAGQESGWTDRVQVGGGEAHGFWQFERGGAVAALMSNKLTAPLVQRMTTVEGWVTSSFLIWQRIALPAGDNLAFGLARLLLWTDPAPLPDIGDEDGAWDYYSRLWRPGKPSRERWATVYPEAVSTIKGTKP